jgi:hypothetical protein
MAEIVSFDHIPELHELLFEGGPCGCRYALVRNVDLGEYLADDWQPINGLKPFMIKNGPKAVLCLLLVQGEPIRGAVPLTSVREYLISQRIDDELGISEAA